MNKGKQTREDVQGVTEPDLVEQRGTDENPAPLAHSSGTGQQCDIPEHVARPPYPPSLFTLALADILFGS